jgi:predicted RNase H-like nuclease (RuvC/YqgF family)
VLPFPSLLPH